MKFYCLFTCLGGTTYNCKELKYCDVSGCEIAEISGDEASNAGAKAFFMMAMFK